MAIKALYDYDFPSKDRQEVFGDDMLVHVMWANNMLFAAAACFRAPQAMAWEDFQSAMVNPWAGSDPDFDPEAPKEWFLDDKPFTPDPGRSLVDHGIVHKGLISFRT